MLCLNLSDIATRTVKNVDYRCFSYDITKPEVIHLSNNYVLDDCGYI